MSAPANCRVVLARPEQFSAMREVERAAEAIFTLDDLLGDVTR